MSVSETVRMALAKREMTQTDLAEQWGVTRQAINNKFIRGSFSAEDLMKVAELTAGRLALIYPDGQQLLFIPDEKEKAQK